MRGRGQKLKLLKTIILSNQYFKSNTYRNEKIKQNFNHKSTNFDFPSTLNVSKAKIYISGTFWLGFIDDIETTQTYKPGIYMLQG